MLFKQPSDDTLYAALVAKDASYDGFTYVCVTSTRIFCRFTCTARKPKPENCRFTDTIAACLEGGFRPCKRCRPLLAYGHADPLVKALLDGWTPILAAAGRKQTSLHSVMIHPRSGACSNGGSE